MRMRTSLLVLLYAVALGGMAQGRMSLDQCLRLAHERNLDLRNAMLDAELASQVRAQAYWSFLPNLNGAATHGYNWGKTIDRFTNTFASSRVRTNNFYLSSDVTLFESGIRHKQLKRSELDEQAAEKALDVARNDISMAVVRAYLDLLGMQEQVEAARGQTASTRAQVGQMEALFEAGRVARGDVLGLQAQLAQEEYNEENLRIQAEQAKLTLSQLMQLAPDEHARLEVEAPQVGAFAVAEPTATEEQVLAQVLARNPAYAQADLGVQSAGFGVGISRAGGLPSLSFNGSLGTGYSGRNLEAVGDPRPDGSILIGATEGGMPVYAPSFAQDTRVKSFAQQLNDNLNESVGLTLSVPIFNNMRNRYAVSQARIQHERAKNMLGKTRNNLQMDVQNALTAQRGAYRQYVGAQLSVDAAEEALRMADERFGRQAITVTDLNAAKARLQQSKAQLISAKYSYLMAEKALDILQGIPINL